MGSSENRISEFGAVYGRVFFLIFFFDVGVVEGVRVGYFNVSGGF
jgi:hypothetical protein